jgi:ribosomal-protein-serine acetyltransferase
VDIELKGLRFQIDERIELRQFVETDADTILAAVKENRDHLISFMHWMVDDYSLKHAKTFIAESITSRGRKESCGFGIFCHEKLIGSIGFVNFDWKSRRTELGYWIAKEEEGKGIITRASKILIDHAFRKWKINRIEIRCSTVNTRSSAVPKRLGFRLEGTLRKYAFRNGRMHDFYVYGLLASEWRPSAGKN